MTTSTLLDHFAWPENPRQRWKTLYRLYEVLLFVLAGVIRAWGHLGLPNHRRFVSTFQKGGLMGERRFVISDDVWSRLEPLLPGKQGDS